MAEAYGYKNPYSLMYLLDKHARVNNNSAFDLFLNGTELGSCRCIRRVAYYYKNGLGVFKDENHAAYSYDKKQKNT